MDLNTINEEDIDLFNKMIKKTNLKLIRLANLQKEERSLIYQMPLKEICCYFYDDNNDNENNDDDNNNICTNNNNNNNNNNNKILQVLNDDMNELFNDIDDNMNSIRACLLITGWVLPISANILDSSHINKFLENIIKILSRGISNQNNNFAVYDIILMISNVFIDLSIDTTYLIKLIRPIDKILVDICSKNSNYDEQDDYIIKLTLQAIYNLIKINPQIICNSMITDNMHINILKSMNYACIKGKEIIYFEIYQNILKEMKEMKEILEQNPIQVETIKNEIHKTNINICDLIKASNQDLNTINHYCKRWMKVIDIIVEILPIKEKVPTFLSIFNEKVEKDKKLELCQKLSIIFYYSNKDSLDNKLHVAIMIDLTVQIIVKLITSDNVKYWLTDTNLLIQIFRVLNQLIIIDIIDNESCPGNLIDKVMDIVMALSKCCWISAITGSKVLPSSIFHIKYKSSQKKAIGPDKFIDLIKYILEIRDCKNSSESKITRVMILQKHITSVVHKIFREGEYLIKNKQTNNVEEILERGLFAQQDSVVQNGIETPVICIILEFMKLIELSFIMLVSNTEYNSINDSNIVLGLIRSWQIGINSLGKISILLHDEIDIVMTFDDVKVVKTLSNVTKESLNKIFSMAKSIWSFWVDNRNLRNDKKQFTELSLLRGQFIESFWWFLHRMSGFKVDVDNIMIEHIIPDLPFINKDEFILKDYEIYKLVPNNMAGFALILTLVHGTLVHMQEDIKYNSILNDGDKNRDSLNLLKWAVYRSVNGMLESETIFKIIHFLSAYLNVTGKSRIASKSRIAISQIERSEIPFVFFRRAHIEDDRFNIEIISSIISALITLLNSYSKDSIEPPSSQIMEQNIDTPDSQETQYSFIEGFRLLLGFPIILMAAGQHCYNCFMEPLKPWSDFRNNNLIDISNNNNCIVDEWKALFSKWLDELCKVEHLHPSLCCNMKFNCNILHQFGGIIRTGNGEVQLCLYDINFGVEIIKYAIDRIMNFNSKSEVVKMIRYNIFQVWVNLVMSWINTIELAHIDFTKVNLHIADPQTLSRLLLIFLSNVQFFNDFKEIKMQIWREDGNTTEENSSLREVLSSLFNLMISINNDEDSICTLAYNNIENFQRLKDFTIYYTIDIMKFIKNLLNESETEKTKIKSLIPFDLIEKMISLCKNNEINELYVELCTLTDNDYNSQIIIESDLGKRKISTINNDDILIQQKQFLDEFGKLISNIKEIYPDRETLQEQITFKINSIYDYK